MPPFTPALRLGFLRSGQGDGMKLSVSNPYARNYVAPLAIIDQSSAFDGTWAAATNDSSPWTSLSLSQVSVSVWVIFIPAFKQREWVGDHRSDKHFALDGTFSHQPNESIDALEYNATVLRPVYSYLLDQPHKDKLGVERLAFHCLSKFGSFSNVLIVRPALLTDGECVADKLEHAGKKKPYRVGSEEISGYTVSRKDVAHFIVEDALKNWEKYRDTIATIVY
ncbi:hypothetical protein F5887DRAFT_1069405 [Amanita rubescens]|nr:hypothetical protein F5887DRAFT_1069405 [Amanita rubescens]